jgi:hypothetical protein
MEKSIVSTATTTDEYDSSLYNGAAARKKTRDTIQDTSDRTDSRVSEIKGMRQNKKKTLAIVKYDHKSIAQITLVPSTEFTGSMPAKAT